MINFVRHLIMEVQLELILASIARLIEYILILVKTILVIIFAIAIYLSVPYGSL